MKNNKIGLKITAVWLKFQIVSQSNLFKKYFLYRTTVFENIKNKNDIHGALMFTRRSYDKK
jgi:hypothetical protein